MKVSEFINRLQYLQEEHGDLDVMIDSLSSNGLEEADADLNEIKNIIEVY
jgi:hypothetical protein